MNIHDWFVFVQVNGVGVCMCVFGVVACDIGYGVLCSWMCLWLLVMMFVVVYCVFMLLLCVVMVLYLCVRLLVLIFCVVCCVVGFVCLMKVLFNRSAHSAGLMSRQTINRKDEGSF